MTGETVMNTDQQTRLEIMRALEKDCPDCDEPVDGDGVTLGDCPGGSGEKCPSCYACYCDGSC